jgi:hypothetical protein
LSNGRSWNTGGLVTSWKELEYREPSDLMESTEIVGERRPLRSPITSWKELEQRVQITNSIRKFIK